MISLVLIVAASASPEFWVVQKGDSCQSIARTAFGSPTLTAKLHDLNPGMGPPPHRLSPGQTLRITPRAEATISYLRPDVQARTPVQRLWSSVSLGQSLFDLDEVSTLRHAGADLTFRDETHLFLRENALLVISAKGIDRETSAPMQAVELISGATRLSLADLRRSLFEVKSTAGSVAASKAELLVEVDEAKTNRISVHGGHATVTARGQRVLVPKGQGTRVFTGHAPEPPRVLLPSPLKLSSNAVTFEPTASVGFSAVDGAVAYRVEVGRDAEFHALTFERICTETSLSLSFEIGVSWWRVSAQDAAGLWSIPSAPRRIDSMKVTGLREAGALELGFEGWAPDATVMLDNSVFTAPAQNTLTRIGSHTLDVTTPQGTSTLGVVVTAPAASFERTARGLDVQTSEPGFAITRDEEPAPVERPIANPAGHQWRLRWYGQEVARFDGGPLAARTVSPSPPPAMTATPLYLRDTGVGRVRSLTPWLSTATLEVAALTAYDTHASAVLALRAQKQLWRFAFSAEVVGVLDATKALTATLGAQAVLWQASTFHLGAAAIASVEIFSSAPSVEPRLRGLILLSAGHRTPEFAVAIDGGLDFIGSEPGGRLAGHVWRPLSTHTTFIGELALGLKPTATDVTLGFGLERRLSTITLGAELTYRVSTSSAGLALLLTW